MSKIILASSSPRRAELMGRIGLALCEIVPPETGEDTDAGLAPEDAAALLSRRKAADVAARRAPEDIVIAADTIVFQGGRMLGKPADRADALRMLSALSGSRHSVYTGLTVRRGGEILTEVEVTSVWMRTLSAREIEAYVETGEPMDKAGAYGIQEKGALIVERVDGDFFNVMGLPLCRLGRMLRRFGVELL